MTAAGPYASPAAFRRALTDKLKALAKESKWELPQLQRQMAYDRLLKRLYMVDDGWIVKGAVALLARDLGVRASKGGRRLPRGRARLGRGGTPTGREPRHRRLVPLRGRPNASGSGRRRGCPTPDQRLHRKHRLDELSRRPRRRRRPDDGSARRGAPIAGIAMPAVEQSGYRAYPLVDHVADKVAATFDGYGQNKQNPSTRFRDLVDLVAISLGATIAADAQMAAVRSQEDRRAVALPARFDVQISACGNAAMRPRHGDLSCRPRTRSM